jgi:hypothetical protein
MPEALVGELALGLGLLFVGAQAHVGHAVDGISLDLERATRDLKRAAHLHQHLKLAQRVRLDRALDLAFEQQLTC